MNRLLFEDELVLHAWIFWTGFSARIWSVFCCARPSRNENHLWKDWGVMSPKTTKAVFTARERKCTAAGGDVQVPWGGIYEWRKSEKRDLIHGLVKQTQFCVSFIAPWWWNGSFRRTQSFQFSNCSFFRSSTVVMNLRWQLKNTVKRTHGRDGTFAKSSRCDTSWQRVQVFKSANLGISSHFSESRDPSYISSAMCPECPSKNSALSPSSYSLHLQESVLKFVLGPGDVTKSLTLLGPVLVRSQQNYLRLLLIVRSFDSS